MFELNNFDSIQIGVASPEKIREWSYGEVTKPETINYRTQKPEMGGLFCERIFGPTKDWECYCGKYKRIRYKGVICDKCGVEITKSKVRRDRMGHIELAAPVSHIWYFKGVPSRIGLILDMRTKYLEDVLYFKSHIILDPGTTPLQYKQVISDREKIEAEELYGEGSFKTGIGAEAIKELLMAIDLDKESAETKKIIDGHGSNQRRSRALKRFEIIESFRKSGNRPEWMILDVLPVIPPELRPMVQLDGGRFATSDLNDLYRMVINRNNRLKKLMDLGLPEIIIRNEKRMLQERVDALIDNGRHGKAITGAGNCELKSLSGMLRGKQGRFRQNLLGKRVDYSGRSVIVVGPELKLYQCGLPKEMAIELFKPFVMKKLVEKNICHNIKSSKCIVENAKKNIKNSRTFIWDVLEEVIKDHPVILNRAPTLHRLSIQAFEPVLVEGRAIKLHPLVCGAFNADFDGDQMAVHVPLSVEAQAEARFLMLASNNISKLSDGKPVMSPTKDMVMGSYYLTIIKKKIGEKYNEKGKKDENGVVYGVPEYTISYTCPEEAIMAYQTGKIGLQDEIIVRRSVEVDGEIVTGRVKTSVGKIIFNEAIPQNLGFVERKTKEDCIKYEINQPTTMSLLQEIIKKCFMYNGSDCTAECLDKIKEIGFKYATIGTMSVSVFDFVTPTQKKEVIKNTKKEIYELRSKYNQGVLNFEELQKNIYDKWQDSICEIQKSLDFSDENNPLNIMLNSGVVSEDKIKCQISGIKGYVYNNKNKRINFPILSNLREGVSVLDAFLSSYSGRKKFFDKKFKVADAGYLTRRLIDVSHEVIVNEEDCGTKKGVKTTAIRDASGEIIEGLRDRIAGRFTVKDILNPETNEVIVKANEMISEDDADLIVKLGIEEVEIRSIFTCKAKNGVCAKCYGKNMSNNNPVQIGEAVGIIAAQSIGEPSTQLALNHLHSNSTATGDIIGSLYKINDILEVRKPRNRAILCEQYGVVDFVSNDKTKKVVINNNGDFYDYDVPIYANAIVKIGDIVQPGSILTSGSVYPQDILRTKGIKGIQDYILREIQSVYHSQGIDINDKHIEIIVRQMMRKVQVENPGGTDILPGEILEDHKFEQESLNALKNDLVPPQGKRILLGITKASLAKDSFLSAASFQRPEKVLTEAAIKNKVDPLIGLKENVIIGKLIPAGTGIKNFRKGSQYAALSKTISIKENKPFVKEISDSSPIRRLCLYERIQMLSLNLIEERKGKIDNLCRGWNTLKEISLPENTEYIGNNAFYDCNQLRGIKIPNSVKAIGEYAFFGCSELSNIILSENIEHIGKCAFSNAEKLSFVKSGNNCYLSGEFTKFLCLIKTDDKNIRKISIEKGCKLINERALQGVNTLKDVYIPNSVKTIGRLAFADCVSLSNVKIPDSVETIEEMAFFNCASLKDVELPLGVTEIEDGTFFGCSMLKSVYVPNNIQKLGNSVFECCESLTEVEFAFGLKEIGEGCFSGCTSLKSIDLPVSIKNIASETFAYCVSLRSIFLSSGINIIGTGCFYECVSLSNIDIPYSVKKIEEYAFYNCKSLKKISVPKDLTSIGDYAFCGCDKIRKLEIPSSVNEIGTNAFLDCKNIILQVEKDSYAHKYAEKLELNYEIIDD